MMAEVTEQDFYDKVFPVPDRVREKSYIPSREKYEELYKESSEKPNAFWARMAEERLSWSKPFDRNNTSDYTCRRCDTKMGTHGRAPGP